MNEHSLFDNTSIVHYNVYEGVYVMRTNIIINDELMQQAMEVSGIKTKKEIVEQAILEFVNRRTRKDLADLRGKITFATDYDYKALREDQR